MKQFIILSVLLTIYGKIYCVDFTDCGSADATVVSIVSDGCPSDQPRCAFKIGSNPYIDVKFTPTVDTDTATIKVMGVINGLEVPWAVTPSDGCKWGLTCPIKKGSTQELRITLPISTAFPKIKVDAKVSLIDSAGKNLFCQKFPAEVVA